MKPKGILFKSEMIVALLNTQVDVWPAKPVDESLPWKYQTRRVVDPQPPIGAVVSSEGLVEKWPKCEREFGNFGRCERIKPKHPVGSILYAKETHIPKASGVIYKADFDSVEAAGLSGMYGGWKPSIFMPKVAARLWFRVMNVRVERVNAISEEDSKAEGVSHLPEDASTVEFDSKKCPQCGGTMLFTSRSVAGASFDTDCGMCDTFKKRYKILWDSINGNGDFDKGKYVWVYELARITKPA